MPRKARKNTKKRAANNNDNDCEDGIPLKSKDETFEDPAVERQCAAIRALRDVEVEQLRTMIQLLRSSFSKEQQQVPVMQFFKENLPNLSIRETDKDGQIEVKWKEEDESLYLNHAGDAGVHPSLLRRLSMAYPDFSAGLSSLGGFEFSNKSVKTGVFGADKLQIRSLVLEEPSESQVLQLKDGMQTPNVSNSRLSVGVTPKTLRFPKCGEMLLSVHGSPLGIYKDDNMETIQETEDG
ncbi:uncharacterized protein LOC127253233 [Andrographis paniculata]|uniref:uncharacterized protein LOC127253233 n=1 Tax=Andrographis paniculata TaxID=175694 RepID=UPI0021E7D97E|nr:uncharacterized protein LOC127253233 [Andrographis paniculata]XP_051133644.1 uncharacterized protein LOC127253233 [Andrographis paniculata]XP_051133645.1 uncharacterized protein LOC127253233 [Andrographis paniculata]XP_051133647.1 uncharacterized protein LOC127253233 [Andrographis paniculata]